jgi:16S rRNA (uracil1498-N3)-methyltransferase
LSDWPSDRLLVFCDEAAEIADPFAALRAAGAGFAKFAVLIGPEGGFDQEERRNLTELPQAARISLGPRVLRADTAAVAALAIVQAALGDWIGSARTETKP